MLAAFVGGAMNSMAGGGSFLSFPALIFAGVPAISANATNNAAMSIGMFGAAHGYREEIALHRRALVPIVSVSVVGSLLGACLLLVTPPIVFERMIPFLLLFATVLFAASPWLTKRTANPKGHGPWYLLAQFAVAIYGGYFGAGQGIMMLAVLAFSGLPNFHAQNAIKNVTAIWINGVALIPFIIARVVDWRYAVPMAALALIGSYVAARLFRKLSHTVARGLVITIGVTMTLVFFLKH